MTRAHAIGFVLGLSVALLVQAVVGLVKAG